MSDDLIKRSDAIRAIDELPNAYNGWSDAYDKAYIIGTLEEAPSADRPQGEWIPCSERLPNENEWVLCSCNNGFAILILKLKGKVWHKTESIEYLPKFVNAWMPLPEPWKGADDE